MTSKEFTLWLKGFITACNEYSPTPKQWDIIKEELDRVSDNIGTPIGIGGWGTPNGSPHITPPQPIDPYNPYKITCTPGTTSPGFQVTTTPGTTGFITIANPNIASFGTGSTGILNTYNPSTSTTYGYPSGSTWSYTTYSGGDMGTIGSKPKTQTDYQKEHSTKFKKRTPKTRQEWEEEFDLGGGE